MTIQPAPSTGQVRDAWDGIAADFDRHVTPKNLAFGAEVVRPLGLEYGTRFLDVAAGSGALSIPAARSGADVVAIDIAPAMIEALLRRSADEGLPNVQALVMDGTALEFADDSFHAAASLNGVSLFPDIDRGLAEMARVVRPGGKVVLAAMGPMAHAEFITLVVAAMKAVVPGFNPPPTDPPFRLADPEVMRDTLRRAGLADVRIEPGTWRQPISSGAEHISVLASSNPIGRQIVAKAGPEHLTEVEKFLDGHVRERAGVDGAAELTAAMNVGVGVVP